MNILSGLLRKKDDRPQKSHSYRIGDIVKTVTPIKDGYRRTWEAGSEAKISAIKGNKVQIVFNYWSSCPFRHYPARCTKDDIVPEEDEEERFT